MTHTRPVCTHTHSYWAGIIRTCPLCGSSYDRPAYREEYRDKSGCQYCDGYCHGGCRDGGYDQ